MKKVEKYETEDGRVFDTAREASQYESLLALESWYEDNKLYGSSDGCRIDWENFRDWFLEHQVVLLKTCLKVPWKSFLKKPTNTLPARSASDKGGVKNGNA
jgi:hypothetical protein